MCWPYTDFFGSFIAVEVTPIQFVHLKYTALLCSVMYSCNHSAREREARAPSPRIGETVSKEKVKISGVHSAAALAFALRCVPVTTVNSRALSFPREDTCPSSWALVRRPLWIHLSRMLLPGIFVLVCVNTAPA